jgi:hypothetical protein
MIFEKVIDISKTLERYESAFSIVGEGQGKKERRNKWLDKKGKRRVFEVSARKPIICVN